VRALQAWARDDREQALACARAALSLEQSPLALGVLRCLVETQDAALAQALVRAELRQALDP